MDDEFPDALREPILRKVQFQRISRIDNLGKHGSSIATNPILIKLHQLIIRMRYGVAKHINSRRLVTNNCRSSSGIFTQEKLLPSRSVKNVIPASSVRRRNSLSWLGQMGALSGKHLHDISAILMRDKARRHLSMRTRLLVNERPSLSRDFDPF